LPGVHAGMAGAGSTVCGGGLGEWGSCSWRRLGEGRAGRGETASGRAASGLPGCDTAADGVARGRDNRAKGGDGVLPSSALARATPPLQHMPRVVRAPRSTRPALPGVSASRTKFVTSSTDHRDRREKCEQERKTTTRRPRGGKVADGAFATVLPLPAAHGAAGGKQGRFARTQVQWC